ncbi:hypothetical protein CYG49_00880 [Candidatus Saccharibacteria bacterium]|nr:MAG: hypothetical protein CYG49_00880 [Candidatus Saccharibacteria bacterium]
MQLPQIPLEFFIVYRAVLLAALMVLVLIVLAHTLTVFGRRTFLYRKRRPVDNWNRQFYPVAFGLIILVVSLIVLINRAIK